MKLLAHIMNFATGWRYAWWCDDYYNKVIWHAHKLGLVQRISTTQVYWTAKGIELYLRYYERG